RLGQLDEHLQVLHAPLECEQRLDLFLQPRSFLDDGLRALLIPPEILPRHECIQLRNARLQFRDVKETSADRRHGPSARRSQKERSQMPWERGRYAARPLWRGEKGSVPI